MVDLPAPDGPTTATVLPAGTREADAFEHDAFGIIGEDHIVEADLAARDRQRRRAGLVLDLLRAGAAAEHGFHVHQPLGDFAIDRAQQVQRHKELDHQRIGHHQVADGHRPFFTPTAASTIIATTPTAPAIAPGRC